MKADPMRIGSHEYDTGFFVRIDDPTIMTIDVGELDRDSLVEWLRSRGEVSDWCMSFILRIMGHGDNNA